MDGRHVWAMGDCGACSTGMAGAGRRLLEPVEGSGTDLLAMARFAQGHPLDRAQLSGRVASSGLLPRQFGCDALPIQRHRLSLRAAERQHDGGEEQMTWQRLHR